MNDENALVEMIRRHGNMIYKLAFVYMKSETDAEDVYQNVFERYLKYKPEFENQDHEKNWFIVATINVCKSMKSSAWSRYNVTVDEAEWEKIISAASMNQMTEEESMLVEAVMQLEEEDRLIVQLYYYEDYSIKEIARIVGMKESSVYTRLNRARKKIQRWMTKKGYDRR